MTSCSHKNYLQKAWNCLLELKWNSFEDFRGLICFLSVFGASPVVKLHLLCLPLLKAAGDVSRSAQDVFHVQEELLLDTKAWKRQINVNRSWGQDLHQHLTCFHLHSWTSRTGRPTPSCWGSSRGCLSRNASRKPDGADELQEDRQRNQRWCEINRAAQRDSV